ncbi:MAG TPA: hypothetical protein VIQ30_06670 [Pseudonocardia sp.]
MVERITDPHKPVQVHGYGRLVDGDTVKQLPPGYHPPRRGGVVTTIAACTVIVVALMVAGIAGVWT